MSHRKHRRKYNPKRRHTKHRRARYNRPKHRRKSRKSKRRSKRNGSAWQRHAASYLRRGLTLKQAAKTYRKKR